MRGYPKYLNSREDYEYIRKNFPKEEWKKDFKALIDTRLEWFNTGKTDAGVNDETHKVVEDKDSGEKYQFELKENPSCKLFRVGYTAEEVEKILEE